MLYLYLSYKLKNNNMKLKATFSDTHKDYTPASYFESNNNDYGEIYGNLELDITMGEDTIETKATGQFTITEADSKTEHDISDFEIDIQGFEFNNHLVIDNIYVDFSDKTIIIELK